LQRRRTGSFNDNSLDRDAPRHPWQKHFSTSDTSKVVKWLYSAAGNGAPSRFARAVYRNFGDHESNRPQSFDGNYCTLPVAIGV
jgi:hypothetical protein